MTNVGDIITLGSYPQNNLDYSKGEPMEWLNNEFFYHACTAVEQKQIFATHVINGEQRHEYNIEDRIFLLSSEDAEKYFEFEDRAAKTTACARAQGVWFLDENGAEYNNGLKTGLWWLRFPDYSDEEEDGLDDGENCVNFDGYMEEGADTITARIVRFGLYAG